jgi:hypothetical protein
MKAFGIYGTHLKADVHKRTGDPNTPNFLWQIRQIPNSSIGKFGKLKDASGLGIFLEFSGK